MSKIPTKKASAEPKKVLDKPKNPEFPVPPEAINLFKKYTGNASAYYFVREGTKTPKSSLNYQCYAPLRHTTFSFLAVGFYALKNDAGMPGIRFLDWITGDKSPWRYLFKEPVFRIEDNHAIYGIAFGPKSLEISNHLLMNFLMASRNWNEFPSHIELWDWCVQQGIPEERAYIYARDFRIETAGETKDIKKWMIHNCNHWPINGDVDFERFVKSIPEEKQRVDQTFVVGQEPGKFGNYEANKLFAKLKQGTVQKETFLAVDKELADKYNPGRYR